MNTIDKITCLRADGRTELSAVHEGVVLTLPNQRVMLRNADPTALSWLLQVFRSPTDILTVVSQVSPHVRPAAQHLIETLRSVGVLQVIDQRDVATHRSVYQKFGSYLDLVSCLDTQPGKRIARAISTEVRVRAYSHIVATTVRQALREIGFTNVEVNEFFNENTFASSAGLTIICGRPDQAEDWIDAHDQPTDLVAYVLSVDRHLVVAPPRPGGVCLRCLRFRCTDEVWLNTPEFPPAWLSWSLAGLSIGHASLLWLLIGPGVPAVDQAVSIDTVEPMIRKHKLLIDPRCPRHPSARYALDGPRVSVSQRVDRPNHSELTELEHHLEGLLGRLIDPIFGPVLALSHFNEPPSPLASVRVSISRTTSLHVVGLDAVEARLQAPLVAIETLLRESDARLSVGVGWDPGEARYRALIGLASKQLDPLDVMPISLPSTSYVASLLQYLGIAEEDVNATFCSLPVGAVSATVTAGLIPSTRGVGLTPEHAFENGLLKAAAWWHSREHSRHQVIALHVAERSGGTWDTMANQLAGEVQFLEHFEPIGVFIAIARLTDQRLK